MAKENNLRVVAVSRPAIPETRHEATLGDTMIPAGFLSPAEDTHETFDIVAHIVRHPEATFFMRVAGDSMMVALGLLVLHRIVLFVAVDGFTVPGNVKATLAYVEDGTPVILVTGTNTLAVKFCV